MVFTDRGDAGRALAHRLSKFRGTDAVVLALPRGGVPVGFEVATLLELPLDVIVVRKLGVPHHPELALGAIGEDGTTVLNDEVIRAARLSGADVGRVAERERAELDRRVRRYRDGWPRIDLRHRTAILVDDGIATGATARAACEVARNLGASEVVVAAPVMSPTARLELTSSADEVVTVEAPEAFYAVGTAYDDFAQVSDLDVVRLLHATRTADPARAPGIGHPGEIETEVEISADPLIMGALAVPSGPRGIVLFAHGSGSSRHSPRNRQVAGTLRHAGFATLLLDLLTPAEEGDRAHVFDIGLMAERLSAATRWLGTNRDLAELPIGYFGASTGAAAALVAATRSPGRVGAVVSRGGRPDLAGDALAHVGAPTLLIVGGSDRTVLELNRRAIQELRCERQLVVVPGATHLFEEPGALSRVAELAATWFSDHLAPCP